MSTITYRGVKYNPEAYKAAVLAEQTATRNHNLMYRGIKIERKFASTKLIINALNFPEGCKTLFFYAIIVSK